MFKVLSAAAAALALLASESAVARTLSVASITGDWNDSPLYYSWSAKIDYDPDLAVVSTFEDGYQLDWDSTMGIPSPVLGAYLQLNKKAGISNYYERWPEAAAEYYGGPTQFALTGLSKFSLHVSTYHYAFELEGPGYRTVLGPGVSFGRVPEDGHRTFHSAIFSDGGFPPLDGELRIISLGSYGSFGLAAAPFSSGPDTRLTIVERVTVPEPASWALMIFGLGFVGGALRRRLAGLRTS